ncbi:hypothetical protein ACHAO3_001110 [Verticillium nonalfalfae]
MGKRKRKLKRKLKLEPKLKRKLEPKLKLKLRLTNSRVAISEELDFAGRRPSLRRGHPATKTDTGQP